MDYIYNMDYTRQMPPCPGGQIYTIKAGDTVYQLAQQFQVGVNEILAANPGLNPNALQIGQPICIPGRPNLNCPGGQIYVVRPGDNLYNIARRFNVPLETLLRANPQLVDPDNLFVGQNLCIPGAPIPQKEGCLTLQETTPGREADGVVHVNYVKNSVMVAGTDLPPFSAVGGDHYVAFMQIKGTGNWARVDLLPNALGVWSGRLIANRPLNQYGRIVVNAEAGPGYATPTGTIVLEGHLDNVCIR